MEKQADFAKPGHPVLFWVVAVACVLISATPEVSWMLAPVNTFTTMVHELGHAIACVATGGSVHGLTMVSDGHGHAGLTWCQGGIAWIYVQAGYLGATAFGALLLYLAQYHKAARFILGGLGVGALVCSVMFIGSHLGHTGGQGLLSLVLGLGIGGFLLWTAFKWSPTAASVLLMFLAVQLSLASLDDVLSLARSYVGWARPGWSDATAMAQLTGVPALVWAVFWATVSAALLWFTARKLYGPKAPQKQQ